MLRFGIGNWSFRGCERLEPAPSPGFAFADHTGVTARVAIGKRRGRRKCGWIEPLRGGVCARAKQRLVSHIGPYWILTQHGPGVRSVPEHGDGERHSRLNLVDGRQVPVLSDEANPSLPRERRNIVNAAQGEPAADITTPPFLNV